MQTRTLNDIYSCPHCDMFASHGNLYCRGCGLKFSKHDIKLMTNDVRSPIGAIPWNTRDRYQCIHCSQSVAIFDSYCRGCGDEIEDHEMQLMHARLSKLAKQNMPMLAGLGVLVLPICGLAIATVS